MRLLRFTLRALLLVFHLLVGCLLAFLLLLVSPAPAHGPIGYVASQVVSLWSRSLCWVMGLKLHFTGALPEKGLLVANHLSWLDIHILHAVVPVRFVSKAEVRNWPVMGWLAARAGTLFHQRGCGKSSEQTRDIMTEGLKQGGLLAIFPEGRIWGDGKLHTFHGRFMQPALDSGSPIYPVAIDFSIAGKADRTITFHHGENLLANVLRLLGEPGRDVRVVFLPALESSGNRKQLAGQAQKAISDCLQEEAIR